MGTSNMYHMFSGIILWGEYRQVWEVRQSFKLHLHNKETGEMSIGVGTDFTAEWNGVPALYHGVLISVGILKAGQCPSFLFVRQV